MYLGGGECSELGIHLLIVLILIPLLVCHLYIIYSLCSGEASMGPLKGRTCKYKDTCAVLGLVGHL